MFFLICHVRGTASDGLGPLPAISHFVFYFHQELGASRTVPRGRGRRTSSLLRADDPARASCFHPEGVARTQAAPAENSSLSFWEVRKARVVVWGSACAAGALKEDVPGELLRGAGCWSRVGVDPTRDMMEQGAP